MKRDIDLARQLLLDIEARGADCSVSVLRTSDDHDAEERVRYHLRLLIDAGFLKEIDRTSSGVPCLRLTDAGHELIELVRSERLWRKAKWACRQRTAGHSLTVVRGILLQWAFEAPPAPRYRRYRPAPAPYMAERACWSDGPSALAAESEYDELGGELYEDEPQDASADEVRYVRVRPKLRNGWRPRYEPTGARAPLGAALPDYLI